VILAVALYPLHVRLAKRLSGRQGRTAAVLVLVGLLVIGLPTVMLGTSFAGHLHDLYTDFQNNTLAVPQPNPAVADWPLVGKQIHEVWSAAADNLPGFVEEMRPQLSGLSKDLLSVAASTAGGVLQFLASLIIAGIMMAYGTSGSQAMCNIFTRLSGPTRGPQLHALSIATVRSVATGVIGVAFIQALLLGVGFMLAGIPAAGVLALIVLVIGIAQLPALLISLPAIAYMWWAGDASTTIHIVLTLYLLIAGAADNVLKPLLLGRGVEVPMPVILLGALGGMVSGGMIGLFVGAVVLAVGYQIFMEWVAEGERSGSSAAAETTGSYPAAE
jgi:predicted PurR-regulated permease PerM